MILEVVIASVPWALAATAYLVGRRIPPEPDATGEPTCSGYRFGRGVVSVMKNDCTALRSHTCLDGRCSYHCGQMCRCATPEGLR